MRSNANVCASPSRSGVSVRFDAEHRILIGNCCEIGCGSVPIDWNVRTSSRNLLQVPLDDRWTLGWRYLDELAGPASSASQDHMPIGGAHVLDPVTTISEHGDKKPLSPPVRHAEREARDAATVASANFEGYPSPRHEAHPLHRRPKASEPTRVTVATPARVHRPKIIVAERPSRHRNLLKPDGVDSDHAPAVRVRIRGSES